MNVNKMSFAVLAFVALVISSLAVVFGTAQPASAAQYAGPIYSTYSACNKGRMAYQSSFTRASSCYIQYGYNPNTRQNVYLGYSFTVTTR